MNFWKHVYRPPLWYSPDVIAGLCRNLTFGGPVNMRPANHSFLRWYFPTLAMYQ